ncbi:MAG: CPBP family intramembrane metalloprotease [Eubacterium sp.]|nr:CPBP family intramembrane metalloprotease [Eubacterium sp.]
MSTKNSSQTKPQNTKPEYTAPEYKKGLSLLLAAVPLIFAVFLSLIAYFAGIFISSMNQKIGTSTVSPGLDASGEGWVYLIRYLLFLIIFGLWYLHLLQKNEQEMIRFRRLHPKKKSSVRPSADKKEWNPVAYWGKRLPLLLILGYGLQLFVSGLLAIISIGFPDTFSAYKELIQALTGTGVDIKTFLSVAFLAPIAEELLFRGVCYTYAERALPVNGAIIFQAVLFGIYHGNLIQFIYATLMGVLLGFLRKQSGSVIPGIVLHMIINISCYLVPAAWLETVPKAAVITAVSLIVIIPCCIILLKKERRR